MGASDGDNGAVWATGHQIVRPKTRLGRGQMPKEHFHAVCDGTLRLGLTLPPPESGEQKFPHAAPQLDPASQRITLRAATLKRPPWHNAFISFSAGN